MNIDPDDHPAVPAAEGSTSESSPAEPPKTYPLLTLAQMEEIDDRLTQEMFARLKARREASSPVAVSSDAPTLDGCHWPTMMPPELRRRLEATLSARNVEAADVWTEVRDWLIENGVQPPNRSGESTEG